MKSVAITIDDKLVTCRQDTPVLYAALDSGISIPHLCNNYDVKSSGGSCRICIVEAYQGGRMKVVTSCNYPARDGISIKTDTALIRKLRKGVLEIMLTRAPRSPEVRKLAEEYGIETESGGSCDNPEFKDTCIACGLCVAICDEIVGASAIAMNHRGQTKIPGTPFDQPSKACIACGACALGCPTNSISLIDSGDTRDIWGQSFKMKRCIVCNTPYIAEAQIDWIVNKTGKDRSFFDRCTDHRQKG
ncbi:MAG: (2Fe-2S)-binding protein [Spirochaetes bacterium]|nr:MAG: (2Fe-2S)-binding protein [Spirochaetota bacterium]